MFPVRIDTHNRRIRQEIYTYMRIMVIFTYARIAGGRRNAQNATLPQT
jgi:hypothetical protein